MKIFIETERLILRELVPDDATGIFEMDSDPEVHRYLGNQPISNMGQAEDGIQLIRKQYVDNGIGRWAVIEKETGQFIGWSGLKLMPAPADVPTNLYDLGYRFIKKYWGKGYATESAKATIKYGFKKLKLNELFAIADINNEVSMRVLMKVGLVSIGEFDFEGVPHSWYRITKDDWGNKLDLKDHGV
ncbi:MAG: N-acetyltransferase [Saprospiraceae bacterium]|nr:MAG: N-acetyltransferase [Saprospiraceae bacterium]